MRSGGEQGGAMGKRETGGLPAGALERASVEVISGALARWGDAFLAYLLLHGTDLAADDLEDRFTDLYAGHYESRKAFVDAQIESLGWVDALSTFRREMGMWDEDLEWNYDALYGHCIEVYTVVEALGGIHAFQN